MLLDDIEVITVWVKGRDLHLSPLLAVISMIVIGTDYSDVVFPKNLRNSACEGCFSGGTIPRQCPE